jgi:adenylate cyclase
MERRLAAILAADVVGYSRLMEQDEASTFERLRAHRKELFEPEIEKHHGRIFKLMGDGLLAEFTSVVDAVECAVTLQRGMVERNIGLAEDRRIDVRVGINLGDVIIEGEDRHGDGVNIAARLQQLAEPGGICIADTVQRQLAGKTGLAFEDAGERSLKNIERPVHVWRWTRGPDPAPVPASVPLSLPDKPSIAVLPFTNMSGDPEQEFFSDGITEDIITELSRYRSLFVVARNSSFVFRGRAVDIREVGRALGVRVVLEGSVRKAGNRIRVTAQLINATSGEHLWADRYDGDLVDVFSLQDEISRTIVSTIAGQLESSDADRLTERPTDDLNAYEQVLRGQKYLHRYSKDDYGLARECFQRAISSDPKFARAYGFLAVVEAYNWFWDSEPSRLERAVGIGEGGLVLDQHESKCHLALGIAHLFRAAHDKAGYHLSRGSELNPNDDLVMVESGRYQMYVGRPQEGAELVRRAMRRNPYHPNWYWNILGRCLHTAEAFEESIPVFERITTPQFWTHAYLAACHAALGHTGEAAEQVRKTLALKPEFTISAFSKALPYRNAADLDGFIEGLRRGGLPT